MKLRKIADHYRADVVQMGTISLKQPLPSSTLDQASPFLLLHHFGPFNTEAGRAPMEVGAHPHRGFEPVTFMFEGAMEHKDSRGNHGIVEAGGVQWMTAGMGIIHSEMPPQSFVEKGGKFEGIQLWVNLPASKKMMQPAYQQFPATELASVKGSNWTLNVVAGNFLSTKGPATTQTPVGAAMLYFEAGEEFSIDLPQGHQGLLYLLDGEASLNGAHNISGGDFIRFENSGDGFSLKPHKSKTSGKALVLSGEIIDEPVVTHGPFVMNNQTEILEAMRDYQMGKMGVLVD